MLKSNSLTELGWEWRYDPKARAGYLKVSDKPIVRTIVVRGDLFVDVTLGGEIVGIEIVEARAA